MALFAAAMAWLAPALCAIVAPPDAPPAADPTATPPTISHSTEGFPAEPLRVGGDLNAIVEPRGDYWKSGAVLTDEHLPAGYPRPTPPGAIEIKHYPSVRRAEVTLKTDPGRGRDFAFWPLFNHISKRNIAMTSPVEMDFDAKLAQPPVPDPAHADNSPDKTWQMSFLYRTPELGEPGKAGMVNVVDKPALSVLSMGMMGDYWPADLAAKIATLESWIAAHPEWKATGSARVLAYNGPNIPAARRWGEVQIPIVAVDPASQNSETPQPAKSASETSHN